MKAGFIHPPQTLEEALKLILELQKEIAWLREQLNNNSSNSSLPPSRDFKKKKKMKPKSGRNPGGQPGHKGHQRVKVPPEQVDYFIDCKPTEKCPCGGCIILKNKVISHQVFDIPVPRYEVTEYRIYKGYCENCYVEQEGQLPDGVSWKGFGVRAQAMVSLLTSKYRLSKRLVHSWFKEVYQMPMCVGSVSNIEWLVSRSLEATHQEIFDALQKEKVVHLDETGHKECNKSGWAWLASSQRYSYFKLSHSRGKKVAKKMISNYQNRIIVTDRYASYNYLPDKSHQICWAHLKRDFQKISERTDKAAARVGRLLLKAYERLFGFWKTEYREELQLSRAQRKRLRYFKNKMLKWLVAGVYCGEAKTARTCKNILELQNSLWHFFENNNVPPTNNHAERQLRPLVISKKLTFGTQSERGSRFIERIFTVVTTCQQQQRDVVAFITESLQNYFLGKVATSLVLNPLTP